MAYVGTPRRYSSDRDTLASIIAGEAGGEGKVGMQAVASVIQNRAKNNFSGYGSSLIAQATARRQFQGQSRPTTASYAIADDLLAGNVSDVTGGALYYANPGASTAAWARRLNSDNALKIGNHYFTDNTDGVPFSGDGASASGDALGDGLTAENGLAWAAHDVPVPNIDANAGNVPEAINQQTEQQAVSSSQQAAAIAGAAQTQATTQAAATEATLSSAQGWLAQTQLWLGDKLTRVFIVLLGLLLIGGGIGLLVFQGRGGIEKALTGVGEG